MMQSWFRISTNSVKKPKQFHHICVILLNSINLQYKPIYSLCKFIVEKRVKLSAEKPDFPIITTLAANKRTDGKKHAF